MASLGQFALGLASIIYGAHHLRKGVNQIRQPSPRRGLARAPVPNGSPFYESGLTRTAVGLIRSRSYHVRNLDDRMRHLRGLVDRSKRDLHVITFAKNTVTQRCGDSWCIPEKDNLAEAKAIFDAIRRRVRYTSDIHGVDTYQRPSLTLALNSGDCDDYSTLVCSSLHAIGIPCRFKVIRTRGGSDWNHIYAQAGFPRAQPNRWISMDASVPVPFGWEAPAQMVAASRVFPA